MGLCSNERKDYRPREPVGLHVVGADWCSKVGRDPTAIERSTALDGACNPRFAEALVVLAVSLFVIASPPYDFGPLAAWLRWRDDRMMLVSPNRVRAVSWLNVPKGASACRA